MWCHFSVVALPVWHSLPFNVQFLMRWVPMEVKKSNFSNHIKFKPPKSTSASAIPPGFPCNFHKRRNCPRNLLILILNFFATLMLNFKAIPSASPNLLNLNQEHPSKNFSVKSLKTWVYDNFFHRNLELPILLKLQHIQLNFSHIIIFCLWRHGQKLWCHNLCFKMFF